MSPRAVDDPKMLDARALTSEIDQFLVREATAHFAAIPTLDPPPNRVLGARTVGEFSWGTFMRALAAIAQHAEAPSLAGRDVPQWVGRMGLIEARAGSKAFSQMYAALALQHYGENLAQNPVWQKLTPAERDEWRSLLDVKRFYDPVNRRVIDLAENYLGVALAWRRSSFRVGLTKTRAPLDALIDRAVEPRFPTAALFRRCAAQRALRPLPNDTPATWDAAEQASRPDILATLRPSLTTQMRLWWDLVDGTTATQLSLGPQPRRRQLHGHAGDRRFLAQHPDSDPRRSPISCRSHARAWELPAPRLQDDRHLLSLFDFWPGKFLVLSRSTASGSRRPASSARCRWRMPDSRPCWSARS
jgi:hypothetical protein